MAEKIFAAAWVWGEPRKEDFTQKGKLCKGSAEKEVAKQEYRVSQLHRIVKNARLQIAYPIVE